VSFKRMVSMERTDAEKAAERIRDEYPPAISNMPDVPYGLCIRLTEIELDKMGVELDEDVRVGDVIHISGMAKVTAVKVEDTSGGRKECLELAITDLAVEDEETEEAPEPRKGKK
jgi:hypothetical protein